MENEKKKILNEDRTEKKEKSDYDFLLKLLKKGKEKAVSRESLANALGLTAREVSKLVHAARENGLLILSGHYGYYLPSNNEEVQEFYDLMHKRSVSLLAVLKPARVYIREHTEDEETDNARERSGS